MLIILIFITHFILFFTRDKRYINSFNQLIDTESSLLNDLKEQPLVNFVIPAWKEGEILKQCLSSITELQYSKIRVIVNAGGNEETVKIANSFKKFDYFQILTQEGGGKIKAINECLPYISEGIVYFIDADTLITDEILLRMLLPLTNYNENVVISGNKPLKSQVNKNIIKYLKINRSLTFKGMFSRYRKGIISGANTIVKYKVIEAVGQFSTDQIYATEISRGNDISSKGFKIYTLFDKKAQIYSETPDTLKSWINQEIRWRQNGIIYASQNNKLYLLKYFIQFLGSIFLLIVPFSGFINISFFYIGLCIYLYLYLIKIRKIIFHKKTVSIIKKFRFKFYIILIFYLFVEIILNIYIIFDLLFLRKNLKKRKNLKS